MSNQPRALWLYEAELPNLPLHLQAKWLNAPANPAEAVLKVLDNFRLGALYGTIDDHRKLTNDILVALGCPRANPNPEEHA